MNNDHNYICHNNVAFGDKINAFFLNCSTETYSVSWFLAVFPVSQQMALLKVLQDSDQEVSMPASVIS